MTKIEERAKEYATRVVGGEYHGGFKGEVWLDRYAIYTEVATEQKQIDIEKACNAFCANCEVGQAICKEQRIRCTQYQGFCKAMEE